MIKKIFNINTKEIPSPGNFIFTAKKFLNGFRYNNIEIGEINTLDDIEKYNSENTCFFLSNHFCSIDKKVSYEIGKKLDKCFFICFHFNFEEDLRYNMPFKKYIITGEHYQIPPKSSQQHIDAYKFSSECKNWLPLTFSSGADPNLVGNLERKDIYDSMFVGAPYKSDWINRLNNGFFHVSQSDFISEEDRVNAFLSSRVCLGFHGDANIMNGCVTERVFEGLSYGCVVLSDNILASNLTNGIVEYVSSFDEVFNFIEMCKNDNFFYEKQKMGYEFIKNNGLYYHEANKFLEKIKEIYG
jgi:hypothetical protein